MRNALAALAFGSTLLLAGCSLPESGASTPPTPAPAADIVFEIQDASADHPLGIDYAAIPVDEYALSAESRLELVDPNDIFTEEQIAEGAEFALASYHRLRTDPRLFRPDRTPESDDEVVADNAHALGDYLLDGWELDREHGLGFTYVDAEAELRVGGEEHVVDPSGRHTLAYLTPTVLGGHTQGDGKPALNIALTEERFHTLEDGPGARVVNRIDLMVQTDAEGGWKMEGVLWNEAEPIAVADSEGLEVWTP